MRLPPDPELVELHRKEVECLEKIMDQLPIYHTKVKNLIVGSTWINLVLLGIIIFNIF